MIRLDDLILGETNRDINVEDSSDNHSAALALTRQATRRLIIFSRELDPRVFDHPDFITAVKDLATRSRFSRIEILVQNSERIVKHGHRLVELSRRLNTFIEVRKPHTNYKDYNSAFVVADEVGVLRNPIADRYQGTVNFNTPLLGRELEQFFKEVWERSEADIELRSLNI